MVLNASFLLITSFTSWFKNESNTSYNDMIYKQLLDFDLNTISTQCLPSKLFETNSGFIEGTYFLQINLCIDANQSYFSHLQRLRGEFNDNVLVDADVAPSATQVTFVYFIPANLCVLIDSNQSSKTRITSERIVCWRFI